MEQSVDSPINNEFFLNALREEDFLNSLCQKSTTNNVRLSKDNISDTSSETAVVRNNKNANKDLGFHGSIPSAGHSNQVDGFCEVGLDNDLIISDPVPSCSPVKLRKISSGSAFNTPTKNGSCNDSVTNQSTSSIQDRSDTDLSDSQSSKGGVFGTNQSPRGCDSDVKKKRYRKTQEALQGSGLLEITMKTAELIKQNANLQKEIEQFKKEAATFMQDVLKKSRK